MNDAMREWGEAWQEAMLAKPNTVRPSGACYSWAENAVAALFALGWMAAIFSGRL